jgi:hypothetical protein
MVTIRMELPIPPPLPPMPPIEIATDENRATVRRYGVIMHPYVRKIVGGPYIIERDPEYEHMNILYHLGNFLRLKSEVDGKTAPFNRKQLIEWTEDTHVGNYDPNYQPIGVEGKFYPGLRVQKEDFGIPIYGTVSEGPYLSLYYRSAGNQIGVPISAYVCRWDDGSLTVEEEWQISENINDHLERLTHASELIGLANRLPYMKRELANNLTTVRVPIKETRRNMRKRWFNSAATGTILPPKTRKMNIPKNATKKIAEYLLGNNNYPTQLRKNANIIGAKNPPKPTGRALGGRRTRRHRRR